MAKYISEHERKWKTDDIVGNKMELCELWNDGNVSARLVRMPKGKDLGFHRHETWVQVFVLSGKLRVTPGEKVVEKGGYYFVEPGDEHGEMSEEEALVLVIRDEPNRQYPISEKTV